MDKPDLYSLLKQFNAIGGMAETGQPGFCLLMALWQKSNELNWAHQFSMTNTELLYRSGYNSEKAMIEKRHHMSQKGYFEYIPPKNRRQCGTYIINFDLLNYFLKHSNTESIKDSINRNSHRNSEGNSEGNSDRNSDDNINKPNNTKPNINNIPPPPKAPPVEPKKKYTYDPEHMELANTLKYAILSHSPNAKVPEEPESWANTIRLMMQQDKRSPEKIAAVITWATNHNFWRSNILSADKLRDKWDTLVLQMGEQSSNGQQGQRKPNAFDKLRQYQQGGVPVDIE